MKRLVDFYSLLGLEFQYHQHGNAPYHYSAYIGPAVLEIYPLKKGQTEADKQLRLGLEVDNFNEVVQELLLHSVSFTEPAATDFGYMTIITDPDGRKVELYKSE
ncbi:hypothetical protein SAMN05421788_11588 [Filimonas lacunae]|uniref:VOC domain-containing protein n=2 Tax=Filimonas lacunae TaxID=477680 RepID=A0A1N7RH06_9BACT|nr:hypothetical protein SAMN05421788_11588 [Filimonas lacunae]